MEHYTNLENTKEYQLAKEWEMAVNSYNFDPKKFAAAIPSMHQTLQQSLYRLIKECIKVMADDSRRYDDRNRASHEEAAGIMAYLNEHGNGEYHWSVKCPNPEPSCHSCQYRSGQEHPREHHRG